MSKLYLYILAIMVATCNSANGAIGSGGQILGTVQVNQSDGSQFLVSGANTLRDLFNKIIASVEVLPSYKSAPLFTDEYGRIIGQHDDATIKEEVLKGAIAIQIPESEKVLSYNTCTTSQLNSLVNFEKCKISIKEVTGISLFSFRKAAPVYWKGDSEAKLPVRLYVSSRSELLEALYAILGRETPFLLIKSSPYSNDNYSLADMLLLPQVGKDIMSYQILTIDVRDCNTSSLNIGELKKQLTTRQLCYLFGLDAQQNHDNQFVISCIRRGNKENEDDLLSFRKIKTNPTNLEACQFILKILRVINNNIPQVLNDPSDKLSYLLPGPQGDKSGYTIPKCGSIKLLKDADNNKLVLHLYNQGVSIDGESSFTATLEETKNGLVLVSVTNGDIETLEKWVGNAADQHDKKKHQEEMEIRIKSSPQRT